MTIFNTGTVFTSAPLDGEALAAVELIFGECNDWFDAVADKLEFEDYRSGTLDSKLDELIDRVGEQGIQLYGRVDFTGDYDGAYLLEKGQHCKELTPEEVAIMDASDETLASELRRRGYVFDLQREQGMSMEL